ncbi:hypothetical protein CEP52_002587 [Fusarium oligoseptatum]|uniref:Actin-like ATPase domain-containing protein n=1 Tax=Fusarium oligoseptatum TaxID=2604345 RepID=A0A428UCT2_9HYPO|nr:hypothetical protein CEP52_002587 [Fusarium oligoseptatum]
MAHRSSIPPLPPFPPVQQYQPGTREHVPTFTYIQGSGGSGGPVQPPHKPPVSSSHHDNGRENRVVLGLDYGTTRTGLSYMQQKSLSEPDFNDLEVFTGWSGGSGNPKIPSEISYSKATNRSSQQGKEAERHRLVLHWTKLELETRRPATELEALLEAVQGLNLVKRLREVDDAEINHEAPTHLTKSPSDIVKDFLLKIARQYYLHMKEKSSALIAGEIPLDIALTHPAEWGYEPLNRLYRAAMGAFHKQMFPTLRNVYFVPEPEACALFTVQQLIRSKEDSLIPGECFVICDAGGGTVDLATYRIDKINPLEISRVAPGTGANCGATLIDRAFVRWLKSITTNLNILDDEVGTGGHFLLTPERKTLLNRFDPFKHQFTGGETNILTLASGIQVKPETPGFKNGLLTIDPDRMKTFFTESLNGTLRLIAKQVEGAIVRGEVVTKVFMSGGLSQSEYLFRRVQDWARNNPSEMEVTRPEECWTAVTQGSVLRVMGLGANQPAAVGECPRHYGIAASEIWSQWRHGGKDKKKPVKDQVHGHKMAVGQITWLVRKGDVILPDKPIKMIQPVTCAFKDDGSSSTARITFCATTMAEAPTTLNQLPEVSNELPVLEVKLDDLPSSCRKKRSGYIKALMDVEIRVGYNNGKGVQVRVLCDGREKAEYSTNL